MTDPTPPSQPCGGRSRVTGQPCKRRVAWPATVCRNHGGNAPQVKRKVERIRAERERVVEAERLLDRYAPAPLEDPLSALADIGGRALAMLNIWERRVAELTESSIRSAGANGVTEQERVDITLFGRELDRVHRICVDMVRLNLAERMVQRDEKLTEWIIAALDAGLAAADVPEGRKVLARQATIRHLRVAASA